MTLPPIARRAIHSFVGILAVVTQMAAQSTFTLADTLRGALRPERTCFDVVHYALDLDLYLVDSSLSGSVRVAYRGVFAHDVLQFDLAPDLEIVSIEQRGTGLRHRRITGAVFVALSVPTAAGRMDTLTIRYRGRPRVARQPPWDGGLVWRVDSLNRPFIAVSCEGIGASVWWPNKDHLSDEPDSVSFAMSVPNPLRLISNGQFRGQEFEGDRTRFRYATTYPINNYNVTFYAGHYVSFRDTLTSADRTTPLAITYEVLDYNLARAKRHFAQVKPMLRCFEHYLGPYPFWRDGYRLVEAPYLGMEHQSAIAYGNRYQRGYLNGMIPEDMDWDYLIIHESGHEYFGNAVSAPEHAEMWLHESFTTYLEALYVECRYGRQDYVRYLAGQRGSIANAEPIIGPLNVNYVGFGSSDHYFKGSWILHTFRTLVGDDPFLTLLRDFYQTHAIGTVTTTDWLQCVGEHFGKRYETFWRQYLYQPGIPLLRVVPATEGRSIAYFEGAVAGFTIDLKVGDEVINVSDHPQTFALGKAAWGAFRQNDYLLDYDLRKLP